MNHLDVFYEDVEPLNISLPLLEKYILHLISEENKSAGDLSIIFCSDEYLLDINVKFLEHNYFTDIITFNYCIDDIISGDLFISLERISDNSNTYNSTFHKELYRVIFHGVLHLIGYEDKTDDEQVIMRQKEDYYLKGIDFDRERV